MANIVKSLLTDIEDFLEQHGLSQTAFGIAAVNDGHLVRDLRDGSDIKASKIDRVREFMADYKQARPKQRPLTEAAA